MEITADSPMTPRDGDAPDAAFRDVAWTPKDVLFGAFGLIAALYIPSLIVALPMLAFYDQHSRPFLAVLIGMSGVSSVLVAGVALWFSVHKYRAPFLRLGFRQVSLSTFGWAMAALVAAVAVSLAYVTAVDRLGLTFLKQNDCDQIPKEVHDDRFLLSLTAFYAIAIAPFAEELFFRSFTMAGLAKAWGVVAGILVSGTLFGLVHLLGNPALYKSLVPLSAVGIIFGATYWRSGNIASTMTAHLIFNILGTVALFQTTCK